MVHDNNKRLIILVFSFFLIFNVVSSGGHFDTWDGVEAFLVSESMVLKHSAKLYPDLPSMQKLSFNIRYVVWFLKSSEDKKLYNYETIPLEPVYSIRSLFLSAIAVPFYYLAIISSISPVVVVGLFVNSLLISLTALVIFCFSFEVYRSNKIAFVLSLIFGVCSFVWVYNTTLWPQPLQALCLIASAYFIYLSLHHHSSFICHYIRVNRKHNHHDSYNNAKKDSVKGIYFAGLGGLFLGLSVFAHPGSIILIPGFIAYSIFSMRRNSRTLTSFVIVLAIILFLIGLVNYSRFGSFAEFGYFYYGTLSAHGGWTGLLGLLVSPGVGIIFYFPIVILLPIAFTYLYRENKGLFSLFSYVLIVTWLFAGTLYFGKGQGDRAWGGGAEAWGPRYLVPVLPFITVVLGTLFLHMRKRLFLKLAIIISLCGAGFYVNLLGKLIWYGLDYPLYLQTYALRVGTRAYSSITWYPSYSPIILHMKVLMDNYATSLHTTIYQSFVWKTYGLAPCSFDVYLFCKLGITPVLLLSAVIAVLAIFIIMELRTRSPQK
jgi:hypothetical protein